MEKSEHDAAAAVAAFIRTKGVTRCPTACVLPTQGSVSASDRAALRARAMQGKQEGFLSTSSLSETARAYAKKIVKRVSELKVSEGLRAPNDIANRLNQEGLLKPRGGFWTSSALSLYLDRHE
jgi:hypothetical protein